MDGKTNEINAFAPLLERVEITGAIVTADALHTQTKHVEYLHGRGARWILTVKANQPTLLKASEPCLGRMFPSATGPTARATGAANPER